jgi:RNA polymerase sigma-70 factor (ECF subfamily)
MSMSHVQSANPETWVERYGDNLYRYALLRLRSPDLAADVVQETFLEALRVRRSFAGRSSEQTWLIGILRHKIIDHLRRSSREPAPINGESHDTSRGVPFDDRGHWKVGPISWGNDPRRRGHRRERRARS